MISVIINFQFIYSLNLHVEEASYSTRNNITNVIKYGKKQKADLSRSIKKYKDTKEHGKHYSMLSKIKIHNVDTDEKWGKFEADLADAFNLKQC